MNAFEMFAAQQEQLTAGRRAPVPRPSGARPDTATEIAALNHIKAHPGADVRQVAKATSVDAKSLYAVIQRLRRNGQIEPVARVGNCNRWRALGC